MGIVMTMAIVMDIVMSDNETNSIKIIFLQSIFFHYKDTFKKRQVIFKFNYWQFISHEIHKLSFQEIFLIYCNFHKA